MPEETSVQINFGASTDEAIAGIAQIREALSGLTAPVAGLSGTLERLGDAFGAALPADQIADGWKKGEDAILSTQSETDAKIVAMAAKAHGELQKILAEQEPDNKPQAPALPVPNTAALKAAAEQYRDQMKLAQEDYNTTVKLANDAFGQTREHLDAEVKLHELTYGAETAALLTALDQQRAAKQQAMTVEFAEENAALEAKIASYKTDTAERKKAVDQQTEFLKKAIDQRKQAAAAYSSERAKIVDREVEREAQAWRAAADAVSGAINSQLLKLLQGHETMAQAIKKISADLALKLIEDQIKVVLEWLANEARIVATHVAGELGMTAATEAGTTEREMAQATASAGGIVSIIANALKAIFAGAAQTGAEVSAAVAPEAGPAAPAIGAAAMAAVVATSTGAIYDVGTNYVVRGGLAVIHPGETIVPAGMGWAAGSGPYTGGAVRPGGGSGDTHFHIAAHDAQSVSRFFNDNAGHMMRAINKAIKSGTHLNMRYAR